MTKLEVAQKNLIAAMMAIILAPEQPSAEARARADAATAAYRTALRQHRNAIAEARGRAIAGEALELKRAAL